jgi:putative DNA methylase
MPLLADQDPTKGWHSRGYLPHFDRTTVIQSITYRLADSVPSHVAKRMADELVPDSEPSYRTRIERYLDAGHGSCLLRRPDIASLIIHHWFARDTQDYRLLAWIVMPNHVHVLIEPMSGHSLSDIVGAWKSITSRRIKKLTGMKEAVWQADYWDRYIRDEAHYHNAVSYVHHNPVVARLVVAAEDWPWSSASQRHAAGGGRAPRES